MVTPGDRNRQRGFTYLFVLLLLALSALSLAKVGEAWSLHVAREKEQALLEAGLAIQRGIQVYYLSSPGTIKRYPPSLESLLEDKRYLNIRRYLRKIPLDPMTGLRDWVLIPAPDGGIMGVHSQSTQQPIRVEVDTGTGQSIRAQRYSEWRFVYSPSS